MLIYILPANMSLYAVCPLYARIPLMHLYVYFITCIFIYSLSHWSSPPLGAYVRWLGCRGPCLIYRGSRPHHSKNQSCSSEHFAFIDSFATFPLLLVYPYSCFTYSCTFICTLFVSRSSLRALEGFDFIIKLAGFNMLLIYFT
jgi:hypothetical protein